MIGEIFFYIANLSPILITLSFILFFKNTKTKRNLWVLFFYSLFVLSSFLFYHIYPEYVTGLFSAIIHIVEYTFFVIFFYYSITLKKPKIFIIFSIVSLISFYVLYIATSKLLLFDPVIIGVKAVLIMIISFFYFYEKMQKLSNMFIYQDYMFWAVIGILLYIAGSFLIYIFINQYFQQLAIFANYLYIIFTLKNLFFTLSIIIFKKYLPKEKDFFKKVIPNLDFE